jgi:N-acyl-D-aspartate/D-glutamate deacylase
MKLSHPVDLLIRQALVFDGSLSEPQMKDVAVAKAAVWRIALGQMLSYRPKPQQTIEAQGLALMPGIIDSHTHFDARITWDSYVRPSPAMGVTTAVIGNCGLRRRLDKTVIDHAQPRHGHVARGSQARYRLEF